MWCGVVGRQKKLVSKDFLALREISFLHSGSRAQCDQIWLFWEIFPGIFFAWKKSIWRAARFGYFEEEHFWNEKYCGYFLGHFCRKLGTVMENCPNFMENWATFCICSQWFTLSNKRVILKSSKIMTFFSQESRSRWGGLLRVHFDRAKVWLGLQQQLRGQADRHVRCIQLHL